MRSPNGQFDSGSGYHLVVAQRDRALPSEGRGRPFESDRRDSDVATEAHCPGAASTFRDRPRQDTWPLPRRSGCESLSRSHSSHGGRSSAGTSAGSWPRRSAVRVRPVTREDRPSSAQQAGTATSPASYSGHPGSTPGAATRVFSAGDARWAGTLRRIQGCESSILSTGSSPLPLLAFSSRSMRPAAQVGAPSNCRLRVRDPPTVSARADLA